MQIAISGLDSNVEIDEPPRREVEQRHVPLEHRRVEDHAGVPAALVGAEKVDDRMAACFFLAVAADAQVHGQRVVSPEFLGRFQQHVELALVVGDSTRVDASVADGRLEGIRLPEV